MSKYSYELKMKVVNEYLNNENSMTSLAKKYNISSKSIVFNWINTYEQYGFEGPDTKLLNKFILVISNCV